MSAASTKALAAVLAAALVILAVAGGASAGRERARDSRDRRAPTAPANLRVTEATATTVSLAWDRSQDNVGVRGYYVYVGDRRTTVSGTTYKVRNLRCGASLVVSVRAYDRAGNRSSRTTATVFTAACPDDQPPTAPTGLRQAATAQDAVVVAWDPASDNVGVVGYGVYFAGLLMVSSPEPAATLVDLTCGSTYAYSVDAVDGAGNRSARVPLWVRTAECADTEPPSLPADLAVSERTRSSFSLAWAASTDDVAVTGYGVTAQARVVRTTALEPIEITTTVSEPAATLSELTCGTSYEVGVRAYDEAGNVSPQATTMASTEACAATSPSDTTAPSQPANLAVSAATATSVSFTWSRSSDDVGVAGYGVYRGGALVSSVAEPGATVTGLACGTAYTFAVDAVDASANRSTRAQATAATAPCKQPPAPTDTTPPSQPGGLAAGSVSATGVSLTWSASTDDVGVKGYGVYRNGTQVATPSQPAAALSGLQCGTSHALEVDAYDAAGNRSSRAALTVSTSPCPDTQPPTAPTSVTATSRTATSIALSWAPSSDNVAVVGYGFHLGVSPVGTTTATTAIFSGLACNANYTLSVDAFDAVGNRSGKTTVMVATMACPDTSAPTNVSALAASNVAQTSLTLTWAASGDNVGVTGYDVYRDGAKTATVTGTSSSQSGLACGTAYTFGVEAYDAVGNRSSRAELATSTTACPAPSSSGSIVWSAGMERGDLSEWNDQFNSDGGASVASTERARSGAHSARQDIDADGTAGTRLRAFGSSGTPVRDAYYSTWLYLPHSTVTVPSTFNFMQWKGKTTVNGGELNEVLWAVYLQNRADGSLFWRLSDKTGRVDDRPDQVNYRDSPLTVPTERWTHLEVRYSIALDFTGAVQVWQDGTLIYDKQNVNTAWPNSGYPSGYRVDWYVNAYGDDITPRPYWHYLDDAAVATYRVGS